MNAMALVMKATLKNSLRLRSVIIITASVVLICIIGTTVLLATQSIQPEMNSAAPDRSLLEGYLSLILFTVSFLSVGIYASVVAFQSMTREKARGNIQALLAAPVSPDDIWLGKSLGVFLPGLVFATVMTLAALLAINYIYFVPDMGFLVNPWMVISNFILVPLLYLAMTLLMHLLGLAGKPATGNVISQIFMPVIVTVIINLAVRNILDAGSWLFALVLLGIAAAIGALVAALRPRLSAERIILSL